MANLPTPKIVTTEIHSQYGHYFEVDAAAMKINVRAYDRDADGNMIPETDRSTGWVDLYDAEGNPSLPVDQWPMFAQAFPLVVALVVAFGKKGGVIDEDAEVVL